MKKYRVWQAGWGHIESEVHEVEVDDDHCPTCDAYGPHPSADSDPVVIALQLIDPPNSPIEYRHMTPRRLFGLVGWECRAATDDEIREAEKDAEGIRDGSIAELAKPTEKEQEKQRAVNKRFGETITDAIDMFTNPTAWAAKQGAKLGAMMQRNGRVASAQDRRNVRRAERKKT